MMYSRKSVLLLICVFSSIIFYCQENSNGLDGIRKNAISISIFGTTGFIGITYERVLSKIITAEVGIGYPGIGLGMKIYPFSIKQNKMMFDTGLSVVSIYGVDEIDHAAIMYLPIGLSYFGRKRFNFVIDVGPAVQLDSSAQGDLVLWANLKLGMRF